MSRIEVGRPAGNAVRRGGTTGRRRRTLAALAVLVSVAAAWPASALAGSDIYLRIQNDTATSMKLVADNYRCWYPTDLDPGRAPEIGPGQTKMLRTEDKASGTCFFDSAWLNLRAVFKQSDGQFKDPFALADPFPWTKVAGAWRLRYANGFRMVAIPRGWIPFNGQLGGRSGVEGGGFCISSATEPKLNEIALVFSPVARCAPSARSPLRQLPLAAAAPDEPSAAAPGDNQQVVYDVFQLGRSACELLRPDSAWASPSCTPITDPRRWDLDNVETDVRSVRAEGRPQVIRNFQPIGTFSQVNNTGAAGSLSYTLSYSKGDTRATATTFGWKLGEKISIKKAVRVAVFQGEVTGEFSSEQAWSDTTTTTRTTQRTDSTTSSIPTQPNGTTYLYAFQAEGDLAFNYGADLLAGTADTAQPILTPLAREVGLSPARKHSCLGYLGDSDDAGSMTGLGKLAAARGLSPQMAGMPADQKAFLRAVPGFTRIAGDRCPGFGAGYPAAMAFRGTATVTAHSSAPANVAWDPALPEIKTCTFFKPDGSVASPAPTPVAGPADPCQSVGPRSGAPQGYGAVIEAAADRLPGPVDGTDGGDLIIASAARSAAGDGRADDGGPGNDILQGSTAGDRLNGGGGDDIAIGGEGDDAIAGDDGDDTLQGGPGDDELRDDQGTNGLYAGPGDDRLASAVGARGGLVGGAGDDQLTLRGAGQVALQGGGGDDTYRLLGGARANQITELPNAGADTIVTDRSQTLPQNVERAEAARGAKGIALRAGIGEQTLIGGAGRDRLIGGPGADVVKGRAGADTLVLSGIGFDRATGGAGADRFVVRSVRAPGRGAASGAVFPRAASAHVIEDLRPRQGDRLVLSARLLGRSLRAMRTHPRVTYGELARGRRAGYVFLRSRNLLMFDADGRGGSPATTVAVLKGYEEVPVRAIEIV